MTETVTFRGALTRTLRDAMRRDPALILLGETVGTAFGGAQAVTRGLVDEFGPDRVVETPVAENMLVGAALGSAIAGLKAVAEVYSADFLFAAGSELFNDIAKWRYQHRWDAPLHLVLRMPMGVGVPAAGPEHSQCIEGYLHHAPGLVVVAPGTPQDAAQALAAAINLGDPVIFLEHRKLYGIAGPLDLGDDADGHRVLGHARVIRSGSDATVVAWAWMRALVEEAAQAIEREGLSVEIIDPLTIKPLDFPTIARSLERTRRLLVVEESPLTGSVAAEILARAVEARVCPPGGLRRLTMPDLPHPYDPALEEALLPSVATIAEAVRALCRGTDRPADGTRRQAPR